MLTVISNNGVYDLFLTQLFFKYDLNQGTCSYNVVPGEKVLTFIAMLSILSVYQSNGKIKCPFWSEVHFSFDSLWSSTIVSFLPHPTAAAVKIIFWKTFSSIFCRKWKRDSMTHFPTRGFESNSYTSTLFENVGDCFNVLCYNLLFDVQAGVTLLAQ